MNIRLYEWLDRSGQRWIERFPAGVQPSDQIETILGDEAAEREWAHSDPPDELFTRIESYRTFCRPETLFLFGRRGTGKTAMLRMLDFEVVSESSREYCAAWVLPSDHLNVQLGLLVREYSSDGATEDELVHIVAQIWDWIIVNAGMMAMLRRGTDEVDRGDLEWLQLYLEAFEISRLSVKAFAEAVVARAMTTFEQVAKTSSNRNLASTLAKGAVALQTDEFKLARAALQRLQMRCRGSVLVMVDSGDSYDQSQAISRAVVTGLIEAVSWTFTERHELGIVAKAAFPTEIYTHVTPLNKGKTVGKTHFIQWRYRDLIKLVAKRLHNAVSVNPDPARLDAFENYDVARAYASSYFPDRVRTRAGLEIDTLAYVIRHTQKKPRQLIQLLNGILTLAHARGISFRELARNAAIFTEGVHTYQSLLVEETLDIFRFIYPGASSIVSQVLTHKRCYFGAGDLDKFITGVSALRKENLLHAREVKRLLLESGVLGIARSVSMVRDHRHYVLETVYEYQVKGVLTPTAGDIYVVHPMFFEILNTLVEGETLVYPTAAEEEEREDLAHWGIIIGDIEAH